MLHSDASENRWMFEVVILNESGNYETIRYTTCKLAGTGSFGSVFKAVRVDTGAHVSLPHTLSCPRPWTVAV